jgi:hypothetical protein
MRRAAKRRVDDAEKARPPTPRQTPGHGGFDAHQADVVFANRHAGADPGDAVHLRDDTFRIRHVLENVATYTMVEAPHRKNEACVRRRATYSTRGVAHGRRELRGRALSTPDDYGHLRRRRQPRPQGCRSPLPTFGARARPFVTPRKAHERRVRQAIQRRQPLSARSAPYHGYYVTRFKSQVSSLKPQDLKISRFSNPSNLKFSNSYVLEAKPTPCRIQSAAAAANARFDGGCERLRRSC